MYIHHMANGMVRKQIYLSVEQNKELRRTAHRQRRAEAEILREALDTHLGLQNKHTRATDRDPLWNIVGAGFSEEGDLSERVDDILYGASRA